MSATLVYEPRMPEKYKTLSDELKFAIRDKYKLQEGGALLGRSDIPYLQGIYDAGIKDAKKLIDAIEKYDKVDIWFAY